MFYSGLRRAGRRAARYAPYIKAGFRAYRAVQKYRKSGNSRTLTKNTVRSGNGVTSQRDVRQVYRRRRMPRRKRKRWVNFVKKVHAATDASVATRSVLFNNTLQIGGTAAAQTVGTISLYGWRGTVATDAVGTADVRTMTQRDADIDATNEKWRFTSGVLDCTASNIGGAPLEVDVYEVIKTGRSRVTNGNLNLEYTAMLAATDPQPSGAGGAYTNPTIFTRGWTPFNCSLASVKGIKIIKKTKYFLPEGETFTYQIRDPKNHWVGGEDINDASGNEFCKEGMTRMLFIVAKSVVGSLSDTFELVVGCTRSYHYKVYQSNKHYDGTL